MAQAAKQGETLGKTDLVDAIAERTDLPKTKTKDFLDGFIETVEDSLSNGGKVQITGFGSFSTSHRKARTGINPQNPDETIEIPAKTIPKFKAGKTLKEKVADQD